MAPYSAQNNAFYDNQPFEMDEDYGFYKEFDYQAEQSSSNNECYVAPVRVHDGDAASLLSSPPILSCVEVECISENLPWSLGDCRWHRLFASSRDGASFSTFMRRVRGHGQTVIVVRTSDGRVVGGFAYEMWCGRRAQPPTAEGANQSFLFAVDTANKIQPEIIASRAFIPGFELFGSSPTSTLDFFDGSRSFNNDQHPKVEIIKPSKSSSGLNQVCRLSTKHLSLVGDDMCLTIESSFSTGVARKRGGVYEDFKVAEFEVYSLFEE